MDSQVSFEHMENPCDVRKTCCGGCAQRHKPQMYLMLLFGAPFLVWLFQRGVDDERYGHQNEESNNEPTPQTLTAVDFQEGNGTNRCEPRMCNNHGCTQPQGGTCVCRCESGYFGEDCSTLARCRAPLANYSADTTLLCAKLPAWQAQNQQYRASASNCRIDPATGMMDCSFQATCSGGNVYTRSINEMTHNRIATYNCLEKCTGSLLVSCCNACQQAQQQAAGGHFIIGARLYHEVRCPQCANLQNMADAINCTFAHGHFSCASQGTCDIGVMVEEQHQSVQSSYDCAIYPCNNCLADERGDALRAACCASCLQHSCGPNSSSSGRVVCDGCDSTRSAVTAQTSAGSDLC